MRRLFTLCLLLSCGYMTLFAQTKAELEEMKAEKAAMLAEKQAEADAIAAEIAGLDDKITKLSGWVNGYNGTIGFDFNKSNNWVGNPNPNSTASALGITLNGFANKITDADFWRNKGVISKAWSDVDLSKGDGSADDDGLFDNGTVDIFNISSLYGRNITEQLALSGLGEINTSLGNFFSPGTMDIGAGVTWTPNIDDLVVVVHPLNYHFAFSGLDGLESTSALGAKVRADFNRTIGKVNWTSTLTSFVPYSNKKSAVTLGPDDFGYDATNLAKNTYEAGLFEYTWINTVSFNVWQGIGVGISLGLRNSDFEFRDTQSYYSVGLSYSL